MPRTPSQAEGAAKNIRNLGKKGIFLLFPLFSPGGHVRQRCPVPAALHRGARSPTGTDGRSRTPTAATARQPGSGPRDPPRHTRETRTRCPGTGTASSTRAPTPGPPRPPGPPGPPPAQPSSAALGRESFPTKNFPAPSRSPPHVLQPLNHQMLPLPLPPPPKKKPLKN